MNKINSVEVLIRKTTTWGMENIFIRKRGKVTFQLAVNTDISNWEGKNDQREGGCMKVVFQLNKMC